MTQPGQESKHEAMSTTALRNPGPELWALVEYSEDEQRVLSVRFSERAPVEFDEATDELIVSCRCLPASGAGPTRRDARRRLIASVEVMLEDSLRRGILKQALVGWLEVPPEDVEALKEQLAQGADDQSEDSSDDDDAPMLVSASAEVGDG